MKVKALIYCTKELNKGAYLVNYFGYRFVKMEENEKANFDILNGKIACECEVETEELLTNTFLYKTKTLSFSELCERSCFDFDKFYKYLGNIKGYALHISNIKVFDKPRELKECYYYNSNFDYLLKAPQNMCYAFEPIQFDEINIDMRRLVLISVRPQWLCKILNGEKDIEVRRKVLKGMVEIPNKKSKSEKPETIGGKQ